jgi:hypothetical protein
MEVKAEYTGKRKRRDLAFQIKAKQLTGPVYKSQSLQGAYVLLNASNYASPQNVASALQRH